MKIVEDEKTIVNDDEYKDYQDDFISPYTDEINLHMISNEMNIDMSGV